MKANVSIEFTDDELKDFGWGLVNRGLTQIGKAFDKVPNDPQTIGMLQALLNQVINVGKPHVGVRGAPPPHAYPYAYVGHPPPGVVPPPYGPYAVPPGFVPGFGPQPQPPGARVVPINPEIVHDKCFVIEETRNHEAGIGCCSCATFNALGRTKCRHCNHALCCDAPGPVVTPPPST